jgi:hypothetical protein
MTFLAFKRVGLPIGEAIEVNFAEVNRALLDNYYRVSSRFDRYFSPFRTSGSGWVSLEHPRTTLQRIAKDTFGAAFLHESGTQAWGWASRYVDVLRNHLGAPIPAFDLAVWLFRQDELLRDAPSALTTKFREEFRLSDHEADALFEWQARPMSGWRSEVQITEQSLLGLIGAPPGAPPEAGAALSYLRIAHVGPAEDFAYEPGTRLNVITGDNSLGKTFLLDAAWAALTGEWQSCALMPRRDTAKTAPRIDYGVTARTTKVRGCVATYDWDRQQWKSIKQSGALAGLAIYGRYDGSFAVWDPARLSETDGGRDAGRTEFMSFQKKDIWDGLEASVHGQRRVLCNGLVRDWVAWQTGGELYADLFRSLEGCLQGLSPSEGERLQPGQPMRLPFDSREFPTLRMPYDDVPIIHASAGVQRIAALAYFLVWSWNEHVQNSKLSRKEPQRRIIILIDEIEAHLHPKWQRVIVPALMSTLTQLQRTALPQVHIATHSPMVMASIETVFDRDSDSLWHLRLENTSVKLEEVEFIRRGRADLWLMSDVFGLGQPSSLPAENAITRAKELQLSAAPNHDAVRSAHEELKRHLAQDDEFWPRWLFWAEQHGVSI